VPHRIVKELAPYQKEGVEFLMQNYYAGDQRLCGCSRLAQGGRTVPRSGRALRPLPA